MIATDPETITTIQRVEFSSREPGLFQRVPALDRQEQMADDRVRDDQSMHRDPEREPHADCTSQPQWCPRGLTRSQKRRVQRLHQLEIIEEEQEQTLSRKGVKAQVWHAKSKLVMNKILDHRLPRLTWF